MDLLDLDHEPVGPAPDKAIHSESPPQDVFSMMGSQVPSTTTSASHPGHQSNGSSMLNHGQQPLPSGPPQAVASIPSVLPSVTQQSSYPPLNAQQMPQMAIAQQSPPYSSAHMTHSTTHPTTHMPAPYQPPLLPRAQPPASFLNHQMITQGPDAHGTFAPSFPRQTHYPSQVQHVYPMSSTQYLQHTSIMPAHPSMVAGSQYSQHSGHMVQSDLPSSMLQHGQQLPVYVPVQQHLPHDFQTSQLHLSHSPIIASQGQSNSQLQQSMPSTVSSEIDVTPTKSQPEMKETTSAPAHDSAPVGLQSGTVEVKAST